MSERVSKGEALYMVYPPDQVTEQTLLIERLRSLRPEIASAIVDISPLIGALRRTKSREELEMMYEAIDCTMQAQEAVAMRIAPGLFEYQLQAAVEFVFREVAVHPAFPTIVGSGKNSTVLHYTANNRQLRAGDLVVIDCGRGNRVLLCGYYTNISGIGDLYR